MNWGAFKPYLTEVVIEALRPIQQRYTELLREEQYLQSILKDGKEAADEVAELTLNRAKSAMGLHLPPAVIR
jgi:tryptophanyl-tRNA synthetase